MCVLDTTRHTDRTIEKPDIQTPHSSARGHLHKSVISVHDLTQWVFVVIETMEARVVNIHHQHLKLDGKCKSWNNGCLKHNAYSYHTHAVNHIHVCTYFCTHKHT